MINPIISWMNSDLVVLGSIPQVPGLFQFNDGIYGNSVLTDSDSAVVSLAIGNNFTNGTPATEDAYDMTNCSVTIKDNNGGTDDEIVQQKWVRVKSTSMGDADFTAVGAHLDGATWVEDSHPIGCGDATVGVNAISGKANDGTATGTGKNNIARFDLKAHPDAAATPVKHLFRIRVVYTYQSGV